MLGGSHPTHPTSPAPFHHKSHARIAATGQAPAGLQSSSRECLQHRVRHRHIACKYGYRLAKSRSGCLQKNTAHKVGLLCKPHKIAQSLTPVPLLSWNEFSPSGCLSDPRKYVELRHFQKLFLAFASFSTAGCVSVAEPCRSTFFCPEPKSYIPLES